MLDRSELTKVARSWAGGAARRVRNVVRMTRPPTPGTDTESWRRELSEADARIIDEVRLCTMTSVERLMALMDAVRYVVRAGIPGAIAECGVWRGGSMMTVAHVLLAEGQRDRDLYLYDTFSGMSAPSNEDKAHDGTSAQSLLDEQPKGTGVWCYSSLDEVKANMARTGYPMERVHFIEGKVEDTIPRHSPGPLALLRLDTDWYESTRHELVHLFHLLQPRGAMIVDDYGHWQGSRKATDEFLAAQSVQYHLHRIDYTGRMLIKS